MRYNCTLNFPYYKELYNALEPEFEQQGGARAAWSLSQNAKKIKVTITANDSVALRARLNSLLKLVSVWETFENGAKPKHPGKD